MALKVVPADDERCDIHNRGRQPPQYVCETCLKELGTDVQQPVATSRPPLKRRARRGLRRVVRGFRVGDPKTLIGAGAALLAVAVLLLVLTSGGGDDGPESGTNGSLTEGDVVSALELAPDPSGTGWITPDGACWVVSIQFGNRLHAGQIAGSELAQTTNEARTVGAAVSQGDLTVSQAECVARIGAALKAEF
jgi:hypothetical protein